MPAAAPTAATTRACTPRRRRRRPARAAALEAAAASAAARTGAVAERAPAPARRAKLPGTALAALVGLYVAIAALPASPGSRLVPATAGGSPRWLLGPLSPAGIGAARGAAAGPVLYAALWVALGLYALVVARSGGIPRRAVVAAVALVNVAFLLAPPLLSRDPLTYVDYGRLGALHGLDPYRHPPLAAPHDAAFAYAGSHATASSYGPLFTLATYALAPLGVAVAFWGLKLAAAASSLVLAWLVWRCAERLGHEPARATAAVALNPILVAHVVAAAHNDALAVALAAGGLYLWLRRRPARAGALAAAAAFVKAPAGLLAPYLALARPRAPRFAIAAALTALALTLIALLAFPGAGTHALGTLGQNQALSSRMSFPYKTAAGLAALLGGSRGELMTPVRAVYGSALAAAVALTLWRTWRGEDPVRMAAWATLALLVASAWLVPWYLVWLLPLVALAGSRRLELAALALCGWALAIGVPGIYG